MRSDLTHVQQASVVPLVDPERKTWFDDDSEWEYEYDDNETEDIFFTLDLTTHVPDALSRREAAKNGRWARGILDARIRQKDPVFKRRPQKANAPPEDPDAIFEDKTPAPVEVPSTQGSIQGDTEPAEGEPEITSDVVQFVGLDTACPYVVFNDQFYSAYWLTDLGTQLWISRPGVSDSTIHKGYVLDVIGASQVRLVAKPAKYDPRIPEELAAEPMKAPSSLGFVRDPVQQEEGEKGPLTIPPLQITDAVSRAHATFMERFSAIKWRKGERDQVPVNSVRYYEYPKDALEIRDKAIAADTSNKRLRLDDGTFAEQSPHQRDADIGKRMRPSRKESYKKAAQARKKAKDAAEAVDDDDDNANDDDEDYDAKDTEEGAAERTRVDEKWLSRQKKLVAMGLSTPDAPRPPRAKRRTKAEMEAARRRGEK